MLAVRALFAGYGKLTVLRDLSLEAPPGRLSVVIGRNGAGKSTLMNAIMSQVRVVGGSITLDGDSIRELRTDQIVRRGVALVPQARGLFFSQTVLENLELSRFALARARRRGHGADVERVLEMFPSLARRRNVLAVNLSGGEQQMLAIAKALLARPSVLLLDEPTIGLAPAVSLELARTLRELRSESLAILLAEQNINWALALADQVMVLDDGHIVDEFAVSGTESEGFVNQLASAYLGSAL